MSIDGILRKMKRVLPKSPSSSSFLYLVIDIDWRTLTLYNCPGDGCANCKLSVQAHVFRSTVLCTFFVINRLNSFEINLQFYHIEFSNRTTACNYINVYENVDVLSSSHYCMCNRRIRHLVWVDSRLGTVHLQYFSVSMLSQCMDLCFVCSTIISYIGGRGAW